MRSFKNYSPPSEGSSSENTSATATELAASLAKAWNGKSSRDMLLKILSEAEKSKRQGSLSNAEIDEFYAQFSPMLSGSERKRLKSVVERLKQI